MNSNEGKVLVVNRSKERKNKFRKKLENGDISSVENYYESCMFGLQGLPKLTYQADSTRTNSLHDLNLSELRDLLLSLMGKRLVIPKFFKVGNAPFVRRVIHLHISDIPEAVNANTRESSGGGRALMEGLQLGPVKCIRVDKEIDEQGHLPYKLLTVPYSKVADLLPESAEAPSITITTATQQAPTGIPTSQQQHQQQDGSPTPAGLTAAMNNNNGNGSISVYAHASAEEQEAARALAQYVLSPALLHLWGYSTPSTTPSMSASASSSSAVHISSTTHTSSSSAAGADGSTAQMEVTQEQELEAQVMQQPEEHEHKQQAAKRVKLSHDPSETASSISNTHPLDITTSSSSSNSVNSNTAGVSGECREYVPASHAEAEGILQRLRASVTTTTTAGATTTEGDSSSQDTAGVPDGYVSTIDTNLKSSAYSILHTTTTSSTTTSAGYTPVLVAAVDCEMCETVGGQLELTRVSLLGHDGRTLLETLVRPRSQITNYLTQYSGITEEMLRDVTVTLEQVQVAILRIISKDTILVGHSLDSDLRALRVLHRTCVDTAIIFPHPRGFPLRLKLKKLAEDYLQQRIQCNTAKGHDSTEDAKAALQLALLKAANGPLFGVKNPDQQRYPLMGLLDHSTSNAALIWHTTAGAVSTVRALPLLARADVTLVTAATVNTATADDDRSAVVSVSENVTVAACFAGDVEGEDDDEEEVTAVPGDLSASAQVMTEASMEVSTTSGDAHLSVTSATASTSSTAAAEHSSHHSSYGPESCAGGNAVTLHSPSAEKVICAICSHVEKHHREGRCFEVTTVEDKSAGPVSSWVDKTHINADPVPSSAAGAPTDTSNTTSAADRVQVIKVPQRCFIFGHIAYTAAPHSGPCPENKEFSNDLRTQIDRIRAAVAASDAACSHAPGTLLLVTAQESLHPVLALIKRKRLLGKATMAAAMWSAEEELFLKDRRKHNLAYMSATII